MNQDEQISNQSETSQADQEDQRQTPESSTSDQSVQTGDVIPQKFVGKSALDIVKAYQELEKRAGKMANELGTTRKEHEELQSKYRDAERQSAQYRQIPTQAPHQDQSVVQKEDPYASFDTQFDDDPKGATKQLAASIQKQIAQQNQQAAMQERLRQASEFYQEQRKSNPDYVRREDQMRALASELGQIIRPEYLNSVEALRMLDLVSRGKDVDYYAKQAVDKAKKDGLSSREEKMRAQSESSNSEGETKVKFDNLSLSEMEAMLGFADK